MNDQVRDITIIGAGPVGLFTAFYGGLRQADVQIIESLPHIGGQLTALYPEKYIYDVAGFPKVRAQELVDNLYEQVKPFNPEITLDHAVQEIEKVEENLFNIKTDKDVFQTKSVIITAGNGAFEPRKVKVEGAEKYEDTNLHYYIKDLEAFRDKRVIVFGGGDSAVDWALMLEPIAEKVTLAHRRNQFRAHEHSVEQLKESSVEILTPYVPVEFHGEENINKVVLQKVKEEETIEIDVDDVIVNYGFISSLGPIKDWGLEIEKNSIVVNSKMETNIEGIYAAGDITTYPGKVKLIASGFGEGPTAVNNAKVRIDPNARVQPKHSTSMKIFDQ
ncbi:NAD(P)/FAD-dependent oxidoreductase [Tenuibacillus multivorans]|uniref:Ferredoxin--NADP reductase n=1 Tax=Tenuibacillus multivorans TaxID=237069 RepID=A0A1H0FTA2_9BACI|nr:NAD(P)/FAD-dependent oxidoreductase [Tenuibacillus multivorans]GEL77894.1 ferredoxin--NADP reductase [Tenuibacillus multivorans]SDN97771.1 thioredoxin reductase (NADPH) [Tenuibacillus multivorans]